MESNVVTLETAKKLQLAGWEQPTYYAWWQAVGAVDFELVGFNPHGGRYICAPTAQEIADQLRDYRLNAHRITDQPWSFEAIEFEPGEYHGQLVARSTGDTMVEALASLWLKLPDQHVSSVSGEPAQTSKLGGEQHVSEPCGTCADKGATARSLA